MIVRSMLLFLLPTVIKSTILSCMFSTLHIVCSVLHIIFYSVNRCICLAFSISKLKCDACQSSMHIYFVQNFLHSVNSSLGYLPSYSNLQISAKHSFCFTLQEGQEVKSCCARVGKTLLYYMDMNMAVWLKDVCMYVLSEDQNLTLELTDCMSKQDQMIC